MSEEIETEICSGETYELNGLSYTDEGEYTQTLTSSAGCDSILTLNLEIIEIIETDIEMSFCMGDIATLNGIDYTTDGIYMQTLTSSAGCDSILNLDLSFLENPEGSVSEKICEGSSIVLNGETFESGGTFTQSLTAANGCDSTLFITIDMLSPTEENIAMTTCNGDEVELNGETYNEAGTYVQTLTNSNGCDSTIIIEIEILETFEVEDHIILCTDDTLIYNDDIFLMGGEFVQILQASNGCDSIVNLLVEEDTNCEDCKALESALGLKISIEKLSQTLFNVEILLDDNFERYQEITDVQLFDILHIYTIEKVRSKQLTEMSESILFDKWEWVQRRSYDILKEKETIAKNEIISYVPYITQKELNKIEINHVNYMFSHIKVALAKLRIGGNYSYE